MSFLGFLRDNARWLFAGVFLLFLSSFGQTFLISVFSAELRAEFGLSHGQWGWIYTAGTGASAALMMWAGGLADRFRVRTLGTASLIGLAGACVFMALNSAVMLLPLVIFCLRFLGQGMTSHVSVVAMARWFVANRGKALAVATFGYALGEAAMPVTFVWLKTLAPWRELWIAGAVFLLAMAALLYSLLAEERTPQSIAETTSSTGMDGRHWTRAEVIRHPLFWSLVPALMTFPAIGTAFWFHQMHFAEIKGWNHLSLVAVFPMGTAALMLSTAAYGWAVDRVGTAPLLPLYLLPLVGSFVLHSIAPTVAFSALGVILMGVAGGGQATLTAACWAEFFGTRHIGSIRSAVTTAMVLGSALGPGFSGALIDAGIDLPAQYLGYSCVFLVAALVMIPALRQARARLPSAGEVNVERA